MAPLDRVEMDLPNGDSFHAEGNLEIIETQQPFYLVDGFERLRTLGEQAPWTGNDTGQVFIGSGARVRTWTIQFTEWEGNVTTWGSASGNNDGVLTKLNELGQSLATAGIDGTNPATLAYGEYSSGGTYSPQTVVPGEVQLPVEFTPDGSPSSFRPSIEWRDATDVNDAIHNLAP